MPTPHLPSLNHPASAVEIGGSEAVPPGSDKLLGVLKKTFGYDSFRPHQQEIVENLLGGRDVMAVMPTGGGKSLCYQLPAKFGNGVAVVISPLISLMKDQVDAARENNLAADFLNSSLSPAGAAGVFRRMREGGLDLLYISPERFAMDSFVESLGQMSVAFFAVDEAHCLSEWGHDFRPDYLALANIRRHFPGTPIAAFTATATAKVQSDILGRLGLRDPFMVRASFNRPNLYYEVRPKNQVDEQILGFLREHPQEPGIIYRTTRNAVEKTAAYLAARGIKSRPYHAGLPQAEREANQDAFNRDEIQVMTATIAFGMGIDKSNVRFVLHADLPKHLEGYYQETGRAGRDGEPSSCILFYSGGDIAKLRHFLDQIADLRERDQAVGKLNRMADFASRCLCRRRQLLAYFEEDFPEANCGSCDICSGKAEIDDATREAQMALSAVVRTGERFGSGHIIDVLLGADTQKLRALGHHELKTYGVGRHRDRNYWRFLIGEMTARNLLDLDSGTYPVLKLNAGCLPFLQGQSQFAILKPRIDEKPKGKAGKREGGVSAAVSSEGVLFEKLRALRKGLAQRQGVAPYLVFSDKTLHQMCDSQPLTLAAFRQISGVGDAKLDRYGMEFVQAIRDHLDGG